MVANPKFLAATAHVDEAAVQPLPNSRKVYIQGSRPDLRVPMREITPGRHTGLFRAPSATLPLFVYDTSGPYTDPSARIDIRNGLPALRGRVDRGAHRHRRADRVPPRVTARSACTMRSSRRCASTSSASRGARCRAANVTQMHYARRGIVTPEMEFIALRENCRREELAQAWAAAGGRDAAQRLARPASRASRSAPGCRIHHARVRARRGRARARHHPRQHQPPGKRAHGHRPQLPGQDQRQHRQLGGHLRHRRGSGEDDLGDPLGRGHRDGPVHRPAHP